MVSTLSPQPMAVGETISKPTYAAQITTNNQPQTIPKNSLKSIQYVHGEPTVTFTMEERQEFVLEEGLHQAVVLKLSPGAPDLQELKLLLPKRIGVKGRCLIGVLAPRQLLFRFDQYEDFVTALNRSVNYFPCNGKEHQYRVFPWTIGFNPKEETPMAVVWISLPNLSPDLFAMRSLLSIASAVGKPIAIDKATQTKSRPSTARVKVIIDLLDKHPEHVRIQTLDKASGKILEIIQEIVYDNLPLYCNFCKHQGHDENTCRVLLKQTRKGDNIDDCEGRHEHAAAEKYSGDLRQLLNEKRALKEGDGRTGEQINYTPATHVSKSQQGTHENAVNLSKPSHVAAVATTVPVDAAFARFSQVVADDGQSYSRPAKAGKNIELSKAVTLTTEKDLFKPTYDVPAATVLARLHEAVGSVPIAAAPTVVVDSVDDSGIATVPVVANVVVQDGKTVDPLVAAYDNLASAKQIMADSQGANSDDDKLQTKTDATHALSGSGLKADFEQVREPVKTKEKSRDASGSKGVRDKRRLKDIPAATIFSGMLSTTAGTLKASNAASGNFIADSGGRLVNKFSHNATTPLYGQVLHKLDVAHEEVSKTVDFVLPRSNLAVIQHKEDQQMERSDAQNKLNATGKLSDATVPLKTLANLETIASKNVSVFNMMHEPVLDHIATTMQQYDSKAASKISKQIADEQEAVAATPIMQRSSPDLVKMVKDAQVAMLLNTDPRRVQQVEDGKGDKTRNSTEDAVHPTHNCEVRSLMSAASEKKYDQDGDEHISNSWADQVEEEERNEVDLAYSYEAIVKTNSTPANAQKLTTPSSKASTGNMKKLQQVQHDELDNVKQSSDISNVSSSALISAEERKLLDAMEGNNVVSRSWTNNQRGYESNEELTTYEEVGSDSDADHDVFSHSEQEQINFGKQQHTIAELLDAMLTENPLDILSRDPHSAKRGSRSRIDIHKQKQTNTSGVKSQVEPNMAAQGLFPDISSQQTAGSDTCEAVEGMQKIDKIVSHKATDEQKTHTKENSLEDNVRRPPMRNAKLKQVAPTTSTKPKRAKKKS